MFMAVMSVATQLNKSMILISSKYIYANLRNKVDLDALFLYFCSRREFLGGNTPHITELATVAKSLPHSLRKAYK